MQTNRVIFLILLFSIAFKANSQTHLKDVDLTKINQKKLWEYIQLQQEDDIESFSDIKPSMDKNTDIHGFRVRENVYIIKRNINQVWKYYISTNPSKSWNGKKVSFGFLFSRAENRIVYNGDFVSKIDTGQIVYLNLKLLKGAKNLATAFEFITVNNVNRIIEFSYLKGNSSEGKQRVQFFETPKGYTRIVHTSYYKCNDVFKNYLFYAYFHSKITNEFHRNMKKLVRKN
jgi:hypothetical protein